MNVSKPETNNLGEELAVLLALARRMAASSGASEVTPEHALLAMLLMPELRAMQILRMLPVSLEKIRAATEDSLRHVNPGSTAVAAGEHPADLPFSPDLEDLLADAWEETVKYGLSKMDSTHLFYSMLINPLLPVSGILRANGVRLADFQGRARAVWRSGSLPAVIRPTMRRSQPKTPVNPLTGAGKTASLPVEISPVFLIILAAALAGAILTYFKVGPAGFGVFIFVTGGWVVSLCLHEFAHASTAYLGGDESVVYQGYLTLNPLRYTRLFFSIILPLVILMSGGIGLPGGAVYINMGAIRSPRMRSLVSAAGPLTNLAIAVLLSVPFLLTSNQSVIRLHSEFYAGLALLIFLQITALLLNLLPLPGLDGFGILAPWLPLSALRVAAVFGQFSFFILLFLFFYDNPVRTAFWNLVSLLMQVVRLDPSLVNLGFQLYRFWGMAR